MINKSILIKKRRDDPNEFNKNISNKTKIKWVQKLKQAKVRAKERHRKTARPRKKIKILRMLRLRMIMNLFQVEYEATRFAQMMGNVQRVLRVWQKKHTINRVKGDTDLVLLPSNIN